MVNTVEGGVDVDAVMSRQQRKFLQLPGGKRLRHFESGSKLCTLQRKERCRGKSDREVGPLARGTGVLPRTHLA